MSEDEELVFHRVNEVLILSDVSCSIRGPSAALECRIPVSRAIVVECVGLGVCRWSKDRMRKDGSDLEGLSYLGGAHCPQCLLASLNLPDMNIETLIRPCLHLEGKALEFI